MRRVCLSIRSSFVLVLLFGFSTSELYPQFVRGDTNSDNNVDLSDGVFLLSYFFQGGSAPVNPDSADINDDNLISMTDVHYVNRFLNFGGPPPPPPYPGAGFDPTPGGPPGTTNCVVLRIGEVSASLGSNASAPVFLTYRPTRDNPFPVSALFLALQFDPAFLTLNSIDIAGTSLSGFGSVQSTDNIDNIAGRADLVANVGPDPLVGILPGEDIRIANINFTVNAGAPTPPFRTAIRLSDTALTPPVPNDLTVGSEALRPALVPGRVWITAPPSDPFLRGDFNDDGSADFSDVTAILASLFLGGTVGNDLDAGDVNDDGMLSFADPLCLADFLVGGGPAPPAPFPAAGVDPTEDGPPPRSSGSSLRVCDDDLCVGTASTLRINLSNANPVDGFLVSLSYDPAIFSINAAGITYAPGIVTGPDPEAQNNASVGRLTIEAAPLDPVIPAGPERPFLLIPITPLTAASPFTRICLEDFFFAPFLPNELHDANSCEAVRPQLHSGRFTVEACSTFIRGDFNGDGITDNSDTIAGLSYIGNGAPAPADRFAADFNDDGIFSVADPLCLGEFLFLGADDPPAPYPAPGFDTTPVACPTPRPSCVGYSIPPTSAPPGANISLPITLDYEPFDPANTPITGYVAALQFDPQYLTFQSAVLPANIVSLGPNASILSDDPDRGYVRFLVLFPVTLPPTGIPPGPNIPIGVVNFTVRTPPPGLPNNTVVRFSDATFSPSFANEVVVGCRSFRPRFTNGRVNVSGSPFLRGDSNGDGILDISDVVLIARNLFQADEPLANIDAADFNDDGMVAFSDSLCLANHLVGLGPAPAPPFPAPGVDPTTPSMPPPTSPLDSFNVQDGEFCSGVTQTVEVRMTNVAPADGFTVSLTYDPDIIDVSNVSLTPGLPATTSTLLEVDPAAGRILAAASFAPGALPAGANQSIVEVTGAPISFPTRYAYFCFRDGPGPGFVFNEIFTLSPVCQAVRPTLDSGRFAAVTQFVRGDCNRDDQTDLSDAVKMLECIFRGKEEDCEPCLDACDANDDEEFDISDAITLLDFLFTQQFITVLDPPYPACGKDPVPAGGGPDTLPFCEYQHCP